MDLQVLVWLALTALVAGYWWRTYLLKGYALNSVKQRCQTLELQLLDHSVALQQIRLKRSKSGVLHLWRCYTFEFSSTGDERYRGKVVLLGSKIEKIDMEAHRLPIERDQVT